MGSAAEVPVTYNTEPPLLFSKAQRRTREAAKRLHEVVEAELAIELIPMEVRLEDVLGKIHETLM